MSEAETQVGRWSHDALQGLMMAAAVAELVLGARAEQRSLEDVATPLTAIQEETGASA